ncbi:hypothetical protein B0H19DRAFT_1073201 [Mycena capillaripes]|nr:hypothetical protein B0H19DRAFT_1073201 [Mycena capillaripes]
MTWRELRDSHRPPRGIAIRRREDDTSLGINYRSIEGFISALQLFLDKFGETGGTRPNGTVNTPCPSYTVRRPLRRASSLNSKSNIYYILFHQRWFGHDHHDAQTARLQDTTTILRALDTSLCSCLNGFTLLAKHSIEQHYDPMINEFGHGGGNAGPQDPDFAVLFADLESESSTSIRDEVQSFVELKEQLDRPELKIPSALSKPSSMRKPASLASFSI